jgi:crotonobetaine/carnitine-CoA ligase
VSITADPVTVWGAISEQARRSPDHAAIRTSGGVWSYGSFCEGAESVASGLLGLGLSRGDRLLVLGINSAETCLIWLACHRLGLTACFASRKAAARELAHAVRVLSPKAIVGERQQLGVVSELLLSMEDGDQVQLFPFRRERGAISVEDLLEHPQTPIDEPRPGDVAEILFTSGTTSAPKAVVATNAKLLAHWLAVSRHYAMGPADVGYMVTPIHHQSALRHVGLISWLAGAEVFVADGFHPKQVWSDVNEYGVTYTCMLDAMFRILASLPESPQETGHRLRLVIGVGDHALAEQCERRYGFEVAEVYGSTETGAPVTAPLGMDPREHARYRHAIPGARFCGWPLPGNEAWVEQEEDPVAAGDGIGEIIVRSTLASDGYLNGPLYGGSSGVPGDNDFRTSDRGIIGPEGALYFAGRAQEIIRRAGENISALEIEAVMNEHPDVIHVAVIGVPDPVRQEEVKAFVVAAREDLEPAELRVWLEDQLSPHKLPRYIDLCSAFPMTESGKIGKAELARGNVTTLRSYDAVVEPGQRARCG